jgi:hypothetical protein
MTRIRQVGLMFVLILFPLLARSEDSSRGIVFYRNDSVLGQFVDGGGWKTSIVLVNLDTQVANFQLLVINDNSSIISVPVTADGGASFAGSPPMLSGTIPVGGSFTISSAGTAAQLTQGWALLDSAQRVAGQAVFRRASPGLPDIEAVVPFSSIFDVRQVLPFDNTAGFVQGVALTNPATSSVTVTLTFRSTSGTQLAQTTISMQPGAHTAFLLSQNYPQTANQRGLMEVTSPGGTIGTVTGIGVGVLGLRGNPSGGLTTIFSAVSPDWITQR